MSPAVKETDLKCYCRVLTPLLTCPLSVVNLTGKGLFFNEYIVIPPDQISSVRLYYVDFLYNVLESCTCLYQYQCQYP